jgi:hypothetical protein
MSIGYYNFGNIQQGNQQIVNSMAGLGNQIGQTIQTHAATESAKTMLPMLQQQYSTGMQKIANGELGGMADVIQAASLASQNPLTADIGNNMITGMQQASHMANTQAYLQGTRLSSMATHPEMYNPDGTFNTSRLGQAAPAKPYTPYQQEQSDRNAATDRNAQLDEYSQLYDGQTLKDGTKVLGMGGYADKINKAIKDGTDVSAEDLQNFAQRYKYYKQKQSNYGKNALNNESIDQAYNDIKDHLTVAQSDLDKQIKSLPKGTDPSKVPNPNKTWYNGFWTKSTNDLSSQKNNVDETLKNLENIHNIGKQGSVGGMPSARGGSQQNNSTQTLIQAVQAAQKHPDKIDLIKSRLQDAGIDPALFDQAIKSQQTQQQPSPQASNMIPAANQVASAEEPQTATPEEVA